MSFGLKEVYSSEAKRKKIRNQKLIYKGVLVFLVLGVMFWTGSKVYSFFNDLSLKGVMSFISSPVKADEFNHTNFLLLGIGGKGHDGGDLTDTIMIASLDNAKGTASMLSLPRDLYIKSKRSRVNRIYESLKGKDGDELVALEETKKVFSDLLGIEIHYYLKVDFKGFVELVDSLGGVEIEVKQGIYDPFYPKDGTIQYETFIIKKGKQTLDGETALKYVRSRKTTSDFNRAKRQQDVIKAIREKALNLDILTSPSQIKDLYQSVFSNFGTNLNLREIIYLADIFSEFNVNAISNYVLQQNEVSAPGAILYVPERKYYGGAYVLLPERNDYSLISNFANLVLYKTDILQEEGLIQVLNGTKVTGLAYKVKKKLVSKGLKVVRFGNAKQRDLIETVVYLKDPAKQKTAEFVAELLEAKVSLDVPEEYLIAPYQSTAQIVVELGV